MQAVGIDIDPVRIGEARTNAKKAGVDDLVSFRNEDLFQTDFKEATVVTLYLLETLNEKLRPKLLAELKPGTRIVSRSEEHTSELQSLMRISYAVFCLKKKIKQHT